LLCNYRLSEKYGQTSCFDYICRKKKNLNRMFYKNEYYVYVYNFEIFLSAIKHTRTLSTIRLSVSQTVSRLVKRDERPWAAKWSALSASLVSAIFQKPKYA